LEVNILTSFVFNCKEYFIFLILVTIFLFKKDKYSLILTLIIIVFFAGFRGGLGTDFSNYQNWYITTINDRYLEVGYVAFMNVFNFFNYSVFHIQFFFSSIYILLVFLVLKKYTLNYKSALFFFIIFPFAYLYSFIFIRQYFAIGIIFFSFQFLLKKKYDYYIIAVILGSLFHYTCLPAGILIYFLYYFSNFLNKKYLIIFLVLSILFSLTNCFNFFIIFFSDTKYEGYFFHKNINEINFLKLIILNIEALFIIFHYDTLIKYNSKNKFFIPIVVFSFVLANVFINYSLISRFIFYFRIFEIIIFADFILFRKENSKYLIFIYGLSLFFFAIWNDYVFPDTYIKLAPYKNILFNR
jgi:transmembrane protein EpsG